MLFKTKGQVVEGFYVAGTHEVPCYLLDAPRPVLFDAGFACLGPLYVADVRRMLGGRDPGWLCLTHLHFDHCGAAAQLKEAFGLTIAASARGAEIASRPGALATIGMLNANAAQAVRRWGRYLTEAPEFAPFTVDRVLADGDRLDLGGGAVVEVLATPGHTWDFLSYHVPSRGILVASESVGCADITGYVVTEFLVDYAAYMANLERQASLGARVLCQGHGVVYTDDDATEYLRLSMESARQYKVWVDRLLDEEHGDVARVMARVKEKEYDPRPAPKQPEPAYLLNLEARVRHLASLRRA